MLLALLLACRCAPVEAPQNVSFPSPSLREVGGRFRGQPETPLDPALAFEVGARCPRITRVQVRRANDLFREVTVHGTGLDAVARIGAALADGGRANAQFLRKGDTLVFPVACDACEVYLGVRAEDRTAACVGPGYSLTFREGRVVP
ncbi:MAG: hypothetical protein ACK4YP_14775 [Myxococcota bacterium]